MAEESLEVKKMVRGRVEVEMKSDRRATVWVNEDAIPQLIDKRGKTIEELEAKVGISIGVESLESKKGKAKPRQEVVTSQNCYPQITC